MYDKDKLYYIDFDKLFENYADKYFAEHCDEYDSPDDFSDDLEEIYHKWATSPQETLGGISPSEFFNRIPTDELVDILKGSCVGENNPCSLLFDRMATEPELLDELADLALSATDTKLITVTLAIIGELGGADDDFYLAMTERDIDAACKDMCIEMLCDRAEYVRDKLLERAAAATDVAEKELYAEPLTFCEAGDDDILALLRELLATDPNTPYIAELMGRYGDDRACADLYRLLDTCNYAEFLEIRNAIEELGGTVDSHYRDFSSDPVYIAMKKAGHGDVV